MHLEASSGYGGCHLARSGSFTCTRRLATHGRNSKTKVPSSKSFRPQASNRGILKRKFATSERCALKMLSPWICRSCCTTKVWRIVFKPTNMHTNGKHVLVSLLGLLEQVCLKAHLISSNSHCRRSCLSYCFSLVAAFSHG